MSTLLREPAVAGTFYPGSPIPLRKVLNELFEQAPDPVVPGPPVGLLSPHAGYPYSGVTAATGYKLLKTYPRKRIVILGPSHYVGFSAASIFPEGVWATPLGETRIDPEITERLREHQDIFWERPELQDQEHSIEVQLPFLQYMLGNENFTFVPVMLGDQSRDFVRELAEALSEALLPFDQELLLVASSDLYHGYSWREGERMDQYTLSFVLNLDPEGLLRALEQGEAMACGGGALAAMLMTARSLGATSAHLLHYTHSAKVTGVYEGYTVGYASVAVCRKA